MQPRVLWLVGASGIGKTTTGQCAAQALGLPYLQLDDFRAAAWRATHDQIALRLPTLGLSESYVESRTRALVSHDSYIALHLELGTRMMLDLQTALERCSDRIVVVECSAIYLPVIPHYGIRIRMQISQKTHRTFLRRALALGPHEANVVCEFLREIESRSLEHNGAHVETTPDQLQACLANAGAHPC